MRGNDMGRKPCCDKSGLRQGAWTLEEDRKLKAYVTRYGCWNWRQLPKYAGLARCGKSCRLRWMNYLRPNIKRGDYTVEDEETIIRLHESLGNRWSAIAAELPGRTDNDIKNHWHTTLKKRLKHDSSAKNPVLKTERRLNNHLLINGTITPPLILESSLSSSPLQPASSDQNSTITTDNAVVSTNVDSVSDLFEAYDASSGDFWAEPFFSDSCFLSTDQMLLDPAAAGAYEAQFQYLYGSEILCPFDFYDQLEGFNF